MLGWVGGHVLGGDGVGRDIGPRGNHLALTGLGERGERREEEEEEERRGEGGE